MFPALLAHARLWHRLMPVLMALCMAPMIAAVDVSPAEEPWPLLAAESAEVDPDVAMLQLRANVTLARLLEFGDLAE